MTIWFDSCLEHSFTSFTSTYTQHSICSVDNNKIPKLLQHLFSEVRFHLQAGTHSLSNSRREEKHCNTVSLAIDQIGSKYMHQLHFCRCNPISGFRRHERYTGQSSMISLFKWVHQPTNTPIVETAHQL